MKRKEFIVDIISALYILLFLYAALLKLTAYQKFLVELEQSTLLTSIAGFAMWFIPVIQILLATMLAFTRTRLLGLYGAVALITIFTAYILTILFSTGYVPCVCIGILENSSWTQHLLLNIFLMILATLAITLQTKLQAKYPSQ
jgi:MFS family permease